jgi:meso-butanediol dehydrogenase/(S,S)-butanediol dehydrogenase/diacetyl reductase
MADELLAGQTAVITGAGRNIGAGIARRFADHGATVVVNDVDEDRAESVVDSLATDHGQDHRAVVCDAIDPDEVAAVADTLAEAYDGIDVLVNNLGYAVNKGVFETSLEEWHQVVDLTLTSGFLWTKHVGELIVDSGGGSIINLASRLASVGSSDKIAYCAAKGGVLNMTNQLAIDLADDGVRVNAISPGNVGDPVGKTSGREGGFDTSSIPLDRIGEPEDVADAAVFLASDMADYISGANVPVDGGKSA